MSDDAADDLPDTSDSLGGWHVTSMTDNSEFDDSGVSLPVQIVLEVVNTVGLSFLLSELFLRRRGRDVRCTAATLLFLNAALSSRPLLVLRVLFPKGTSGRPAQAASSQPIWLLETLLRAASPAARALLRSLLVLLAFASLTLLEVRNLRSSPPSLREFGQELYVSFCKMLPAFPFLIMAFTCLGMAAVFVLGSVLPLSRSSGEDIVFYGQFYGPFSAIYWVTKRMTTYSDRHKRSCTELPMSGVPLGASCRSRGPDP